MKCIVCSEKFSEDDIANHLVKTHGLIDTRDMHAPPAAAATAAFMKRSAMPAAAAPTPASGAVVATAAVASAAVLGAAAPPPPSAREHFRAVYTPGTCRGPGFLYVLLDTISNDIKIGRAIDVTERLQHAKTYNQHLRLIAVYWALDSDSAEDAAWHVMRGDYDLFRLPHADNWTTVKGDSRGLSEWFRATAEQACFSAAKGCAHVNRVIDRELREFPGYGPRDDFDAASNGWICYSPTGALWQAKTATRERAIAAADALLGFACAAASTPAGGAGRETTETEAADDDGDGDDSEGDE